MPSVTNKPIMVSVIMPNVVMPSVVASMKGQPMRLPKHSKSFTPIEKNTITSGSVFTTLHILRNLSMGPISSSVCSRQGSGENSKKISLIIRNVIINIDK